MNLHDFQVVHRTDKLKDLNIVLTFWRNLQVLAQVAVKTGNKMSLYFFNVYHTNI